MGKALLLAHEVTYYFVHYQNVVDEAFALFECLPVIVVAIIGTIAVLVAIIMTVEPSQH